MAACTPQGGADKGALGCATSAADLKIKGGDPVRGKLAQQAFEAHGQGPRRAGASARPARARSSSRATACGLSSATAATRASTPTSSSSTTRVDQQVPAGHARRADAEVDAVPERVQPRLRSQEQHLEHGGRAGLGHDDPVDHDRRRPGDVRAPSADLPRQPERPGRSRTRSRTPRRTPTRSARPTRTRRPARRPATTRPSRASQCGETKLVITPAAADPGRHELQGRRQLRRPARASA